MEWVTASDVPGEAWRRLLEYANLDLAQDAIMRVHGPPSANSRSNYRKQAGQIRASLLQAREYYEASIRSSLYTSPNHLYYSIMSLASAAMLLHGDGRVSYDYLRRNPDNRSHGLRFTTGVDSRTAVSGTSILATSYVEVLPTGHFRNWYCVLPVIEDALARVTIIAHNNGQIVAWQPVGHGKKLDWDRLVGRKFSILDMMRRLPDLRGDLVRSGQRIAATRISHHVTYDIKKNRQDLWRLHGADTESEFEQVLECFAFSPSIMHRVNARLEPTRGVISVTLPDGSGPLFRWPDYREGLDNEQIAYAEALDTYEFVDAYVCSFGLSMLARYFPDLWLGAIDAHGRASKLVEGFVAVALQKVPLLALRLLSGSNITVSAHRPPWFA